VRGTDAIHTRSDLSDRNLGRPLSRGPAQAQLGDYLALHRTFIGAVERGERKVPILNLQQNAKALRVPHSQLLDNAPAGLGRSNPRVPAPSRD